MTQEGFSKEKERRAKELIANRTWRLNNLYKIKTKEGLVVTFEPNWAQIMLLRPHYLNLILKARQLGITTLFSILFLDTCLFNDNTHAAIIADSKPIAKEIFVDKVKFAYDNLPDWVRRLTPAYRDNVNELRFSNGSVFRIATTLRGGTTQLLHITEFAKVCVENPSKADEIISGALNTLQAGQFACIESTARGKDGIFYDMCCKAMEIQKSGKVLNPMDWKFWFFAWWQHPDYVLDDDSVVIMADYKKYFDELEAKGIVLNNQQKAWYVQKAELQGEYMKREFPSTPDEAFETAHEGYYFASQVSKARDEKRISHVPPDDHALQFAAWDIGIDDSTAIWTFQVIGREIHFLDYYENSGEALVHYNRWIKSLRYPIEKHWMPHDAAGRDKATGKAYADYAREMGMKVQILERSKNELIDIEMARTMFSRLFFDNVKCSKGIEMVQAYKKEWNDKLGCFRERPCHDKASHGTKALIYALNAIDRMTGGKAMSAQEWQRIRDRYS